MAATYTWIAPVHDVLACVVEPRARSLGLKWTGVVDGEHVLEVAVGTGLSFRHLLRENPMGWTVGVDRTPAMLRRAARRAHRTDTTNYELRLGDAYALDFPDRSFDVILNSYMFDMLPEGDFVPVLEEFYRVLRPGGRLVMMNMTLGSRWYHRIWEYVYAVCPPLLGGCRGVTVEPYLRKAGFVQTRRAFVSQWTFPSEVLFGLRPR